MFSINFPSKTAHSVQYANNVQKRISNDIFARGFGRLWDGGADKGILRHWGCEGFSS